MQLSVLRKKIFLKDKINTIYRNDLKLILKKKTGLSLRKIAEILDINQSIVARIKVWQGTPLT